MNIIDKSKADEFISNKYSCPTFKTGSYRVRFS